MQPPVEGGLRASSPGPRWGYDSDINFSSSIVLKGFLAYYEICDLVTNEGWKVIHDPSGTMGPYAYKGDQWVSFDDVRMIRHKSQFVKNRKLGGAMIWALDLDDFG